MANLLIDGASAGEGDGFVDVTIRLDAAAASTVTVEYIYDDSTATGGNDYVYFSGSLSFAPGETSKTVRIQLRENTTVEGPEVFFVGLRNAVNATITRPWAAVTLLDNDTVVDTPRLFVDDVVVDEKQGVALFVVRLGRVLGEASSGAVTVDYGTRDGSAVAGQDYVARSGSLSFAPGESVKTVAVTLTDDAVAEALERFEFVLSNPARATLGDASATAEIAPSDGTGSAQPRIGAGPVTVSETDRFVDIPVSLHAPSTQPVSVDYVYDDSTGTGGNDYVYFSGTLSFAPGETVKTVRVQLRDNTTAESPEIFYFGLRNASNATVSRAWTPVTIVDDDTIVDTPSLFVDDLLVDEKQGTAQFVVRLGRSFGEAANAPTTVAFATRDLSAVAGQDFVGTSGRLTFQPGESVKTVTVDLIDDTTAESLERFELVLSDPVNATLGDGVALAQVALSDGTGSAQPRISATAATVGEGDRFIDIPVLLHAPSTLPISVEFVYDDSTATGGNDYVYFSGTLNFAPGETAKTVRVQLRNDTNAEGPETFYFGLRNATNATIPQAWVPVSIVDDDTIVDTPRLHLEDVQLDEKQGSARFVVRLGASLGEAANGGVTVEYATRDGTALGGQDFVAQSGTLTFQPGESTKTIVVDLLDDTLAEPVERFGLVLSNPVNAAIADGAAVGEIGLSDGTGSSQPRISVAPVTVGEGDRYVDLPVRLHAPSTLPVSVGFVYDDSTATGSNDYVYFSGTLNFAPGETVKSVRVQLRDGVAVESTEVFGFVLRNPVNATLGQASAQVTVIDDDGARVPQSKGRSDDVYVVDSTSVDFIEAADGGFDVVRSSVSFTLPAELEGVILTGSALNATGHDGANLFMGNASNNSFDGRGGVDTVAYPGADSAYAVGGNQATRTVSRSGEGSDTLLSIERLQFTNVVQAYDTSPGGNTWGAFALLNAAFNQFPDATALGQWTAMLDRSGGDMNELARQMIQLYAPGVGNEALVSHLWSTVVETPITPNDLSFFVGQIESGVYTQASLAVVAATYFLNTDEFAALVGQPMLLDVSWFTLPGA